MYIPIQPHLLDFLQLHNELMFVNIIYKANYINNKTLRTFLIVLLCVKDVREMAIILLPLAVKSKITPGYPEFSGLPDSSLQKLHPPMILSVASAEL